MSSLTSLVNGTTYQNTALKEITLSHKGIFEENKSADAVQKFKF